MGDNEVYITTTKQSSSMRQILAAIEHLHKQEFEAAITLAAAAEGQIAEGAIRHLFRIMRQKLPKADHNKVINWLKHPTGEDKITITEFEAAIASHERSINSSASTNRPTLVLRRSANGL
jgi:hypothetical protein